MATKCKILLYWFLIDGTPSVRTFANTKDIEKNNKEYIQSLNRK